MKNIGFIGLGAMGNPMASNFLKNGYQTYVYDISTKAMDLLEERGAKACASSQELASKSDIIFSSLPNDEIVIQTMAGTNGVIESCRPASCIVDLSSVSPNTSVKMNKLAKTRYISYLDAPVSGGVKGAIAGTLTIMVGGDKKTYDELQTELKCIGKKILYIGESGFGDTIKILNNLLLGCNMAALAEALVLGEKCGLTLSTMNEIFSISSGRSYVQENKIQNFIMKDSYHDGFAVALQYKDLMLALDTARTHKMPMPMTATASQIYEFVNAMDYGREDISVITKALENLTN